jgi:hypothetical protein
VQRKGGLLAPIDCSGIGRMPLLAPIDFRAGTAAAVSPQIPSGAAA